VRNINPNSSMCYSSLVKPITYSTCNSPAITSQQTGQRAYNSISHSERSCDITRKYYRRGQPIPPSCQEVTGAINQSPVKNWQEP
jgi:hypothetical protein